MRTFETYQELRAAYDAGFRFLPEHGPAQFRCETCGELWPISMDGSGGTGYGVFTADAQRVERFRCYACCADYQRQEMIDTGRAYLYLTHHDTNTATRTGFVRTYEVTDWAGKLRFRCTDYRRNPSGGGFGSQRTDAWFIGPDGYVWHAVNRGDSQVALCKRTKQKGPQS